MKKSSLALSLALFVIPAVAALAQSESDAPPPEPPTNLFFDTDFDLRVPKFIFSYGVRALTGAKSSFRGTGHIETIQDFGDLTATGIARSYQDGAVGLDTRFTFVDDGTGRNTAVPIAPDGKTNTWGYSDPSQVLANGNIAMHAYAADVVDTGPHSKNPGPAFGTELTLERDLGKISAHFDWNITGGLSVNDINAKFSSIQTSTISTVTDIYSLDGAPAPAAPYTAPSTTSVTVVDNNGNPVLGSDGSTQSVTVDNTTPLVSTPLSRTTTTAVDTTSVTNFFHLKGAYFTLRAGPDLVFPLTTHFRVTLSVGAALAYAGTTYSVQQDFIPPTGSEVISTVENTKNLLLPGYYADLDMEYWLTDHAGFYLGLVYQNSGDFTQSIITTSSDYLTKVDLSSLEGLRFGVNVKF